MPGVYLSYPFCAQKCTYCNFASGVFARDLESGYLDALRGEIRAHTWPWTPETVYLGGGTPSRLAPVELEGILAEIPGRPWREATIEAAPGTVTAELARSWRLAGITRMSLGAQSFVGRELAATGRRHTAETIAADVSVLRNAGLDDISIDLIAGLPHQTLASWSESLDWIGRLAPPHVSVYMLEVDDDSRLGRELRVSGTRFGATAAPPEDQVVAMYEMAAERLAAMGIERYEISNFARRGSESRHNLKYWRLEPYAGFGADAHSFDGAMRSQNVESPGDYVDRWKRGLSPRADCAPANLSEERFFVGLRLAEGVRPSAEEREIYSGPIDRFLNNGLLIADGDTLRLTRQGILFSNDVFVEFLQA